eukprot:TRINITY_DN391_c0_g2_i3.p1 TRINITY_DN391_c0_g2~~TRINITY_DN391_c0_g2_i3.p1  ORF type:complete len:963 (-),score=173.57 TRINITY_DN391_c0_g2_i3:141-2699(-)
MTEPKVIPPEERAPDSPSFAVILEDFSAETGSRPQTPDLADPPSYPPPPRPGMSRSESPGLRQDSLGSAARVRELKTREDSLGSQEGRSSPVPRDDPTESSGTQRGKIVREESLGAESSGGTQRGKKVREESLGAESTGGTQRGKVVRDDSLGPEGSGTQRQSSFRRLRELSKGDEGGSKRGDMLGPEGRSRSERSSFSDRVGAGAQRLMNSARSFTTRAKSNFKFMDEAVPLTLTWEINEYMVQVPVAHGKGFFFKTLLKKCYGYVGAGQTLAIMGGSGAGKTTLLDILTQRVSGYEGSVKVNGELLTPSIMRKFSGYVPQYEMLVATMTVHETLEFYAMLKLPNDLSIAEKKKRVDDIIGAVRLTQSKDTLIGNEFIRGLSGGEKRRVSIAIELITKPSLLFLDEPTSGLDAATSYTVMDTIAGLAKTGRTVITTIHQPRTAIFNLFDLLLLMSKGRVVYFGPAKQVSHYFESIGYPIPRYNNPADYFVDLITPGMVALPDVPTLSTQQIAALPDQYAASPQFAAMRQTMAELKPPPNVNLQQLSAAAKEWRPSVWTQTKLLSKRVVINSIRSPLEIKGRIAQSLTLGFLTGFLFFGLDHSQGGIQSRGGILINSALFLLIITAVSAVMVFPSERAILLRERKSGVFSIEAYILSKTVIETVEFFLYPFLYGVPLYLLSNLRNEAQYLFFYIFIVWIAMNFSQAWGLIIGTFVPNGMVGALIVPIFMMGFGLMGGYFLNIDNMPIFLRWFAFINPFRYILEAMFINEFAGVKFNCSDDQRIPLGNGEYRCPIDNGDAVVESYYGLRSSSNGLERQWVCVLVALLWTFASKFLVYCALKYLDRKATNTKNT